MSDITALAEWQALKSHQQTIANQTMRQWFAEDNARFERFSLYFDDILFDFSKNRITPQTIPLLCNLAHAMNLPHKINALFQGEKVNTTEGRPALHTALRHREETPIYVNGFDIMPGIKATLSQMRDFTDAVRQQQWRGATGKAIRHIVNIGIGGSHLGPLMVTYALKSYSTPALQCHFISNIDNGHVNEVLAQLDPETTLFIISSKSFTTLETLTNAHTARQWLQQKLGSVNLAAHFVAVTADEKKALAFGIPPQQIFSLWDWVGGRYSVWSAIGLPVALMIGMDHFLKFLEGGYHADIHFRQTEFSKNIPVLMALLGIWYINFFDAHSHAIIPYAQQLKYFRAHLQQLDMESNGKQTTQLGTQSHYATGPIILGEHGCNGQHAFHQLFHQGAYLVPIDFILVATQETGLQNHQDILIASGLSQAQALMQGKTFSQATQELGSTDPHEMEWLAQHKSIPGNRPSNTFFLKKLTPFNLGALLAFYEHKVFVQGVIWNINSFDQWGVELGKQLLPNILDQLNNTENSAKQDSSTAGLINFYKQVMDV